MPARIACAVFLPVPAVAELPAAPKDGIRRPHDIPLPADTPDSLQRATLGTMLYVDPRLSGAQNTSCASCRNPSFAWEVPVPGAVGAQNTTLGRQAPTIRNVAWTPHFFWDGRAPDLEAQASGPITAAVEMNGRFPDIIARLSEVPEHVAWFDRLFPGQGITEQTIVAAIATYERTVVSAWSPFDRWVDGDEIAIPEAAKRGFALFAGKARCAECHAGWNFTDNLFHDIGLPTDDPGRAAIAPDEPGAQHAFKTPGLRDTVRRLPYMHNGLFATLGQVMAHYLSGGIDRPSRSPKMRPVALTEAEAADIVAFLETLTARNEPVPAPVLPTR